MDWIDHPDPAVGEEVAAVAARLRKRFTGTSNDVLDAIHEAVPSLLGDEELDALLGASVKENVITVLHILELGVRGVDATNAPIEYARRLAQRDVGIAALIRAYRVGQTRFERNFIAELLRGRGGDHVEGGAAQWMVEIVSRYIDNVVEQLIETYEQARDEWLSQRSAVFVQRVRTLLRESTVDFDAAQAMLGAYRLDQLHRGAIIWWDDSRSGPRAFSLLHRCAVGLAEAANCSGHPLFVPYDESSAWLWLPEGAHDVANAVFESALDDSGGVCVALGESLGSLAGFRRTHRQAHLAQVVALAARPARSRLTAFSDVAAISTMCSDLEAARAWVSETLGALAADDERCAVLRETARVFLATGGSFTATAGLMILHRNSAQYRIRRAEELRGRPLREGRLDVELALLACRYLGSAVLPAAPAEGERQLLVGALGS